MASLAIFLCPERVGIARVNAPGNKPSYNSPIWQDVEDMQQLLSEPAMLAAMVREKAGDENKYDLYISLYPGIYSEIVFSHDKRKKNELERLRQSELETVFHGEYASLYTYDLLLDKGKPSFNGKSRRIIFTVSKQWVNLLKEAFAAQKMKLVRLAPVDAVAAESALRYWAVADKGISLAMTLDEVCTSIAFMRGGNIMAMRTLPGGFGAVLNVYREVTGMTSEECRAMILTNGVHVAPDELTYTTIQDEVLRTVNRLATDVVMVGEIRDEETAKIAMTLSITGHLVFSTLHTFDSPSAVMRLVDMGVDPYMVFSALSAVISQRLVRKLCPICQQEYLASVAEKQYLGVPLDEELKLHAAQGCEECNYTGYKGRTAVHEILMMSPEIRDNLANGGNTESIRKIARSEGMKTLLDNLRELVLDGTTTMEELRRTYSESV